MQVRLKSNKVIPKSACVNAGASLIPYNQNTIYWIVLKSCKKTRERGSEGKARENREKSEEARKQWKSEDIFSTKLIE